MTGRLKDILLTRDGSQIVSFSTKTDYREEFDRLKDCDVDIEIKKHSEKRSTSANRYCWKLCGLIAEALNDGQTTKDDVYRQAIREVGIYRDFELLDEKCANTLCIAWGRLGTGWVTEQLDTDGERVTIRAYYGSSTYTRKQMARLIDYIVQDAKQLGIPTETPDETAKMLSLWEQEQERLKK